MAQLLLDLNYSEQYQLGNWLALHTDCKLRTLYDHFIKQDERERCAVEGSISSDLYDYLRQQYGDGIKSGIRFG